MSGVRAVAGIWAFLGWIVVAAGVIGFFWAMSQEPKNTMLIVWILVLTIVGPLGYFTSWALLKALCEVHDRQSETLTVLQELRGTVWKGSDKSIDDQAPSRQYQRLGEDGIGQETGRNGNAPSIDLQPPEKNEIKGGAHAREWIPEAHQKMTTIRDCKLYGALQKLPPLPSPGFGVFHQPYGLDVGLRPVRLLGIVPAGVQVVVASTHGDAWVRVATQDGSKGFVAVDDLEPVL